MKICWDNLENIYINTKGNLTNGKHIILIKKCKNCEEEYIGKEKSMFCSLKCKSSGKNHPMYGNKHSKESKQKMSNSHKGKIISEKTKEKMRKRMSGENNPLYGKFGKYHPAYGNKHTKETKEKIGITHKEEKNNNWKGGVQKLGLPLYDTYNEQINWCEETRNNNGLLEIKCTYCGKWFISKLRYINHRIQTIKGNYKGENRLYCSDGCKYACPIYNQRKWPKGFKVNTSREVQPQLRQMVFERDNWKCVKCFSKENLHCHHIYGILYEKIESADIDNCITVCKNCHKEIHKRRDCLYNDLKCKEI